MLRSLALICGFRSTSDLPPWLSGSEREQLREFLEAAHRIDQIGPNRFMLDDREIDYSTALGLPDAPSGIMALGSNLLGWLGNQGWAMGYLYSRQKAALQRLRRNLRE
jgi:hypothetical protein